jgi:hypothetical protein
LRLLARDYAMRALDTFVAADDGQGALRFAALVLPRYASDGAFIRRVTEIALGQRDLVLVRDLGRSWLALAPRDPERIDKRLSAELATGALAPALLLARRLVDVAPNTRNRLRLAQVADWRELARKGSRAAAGRALALGTRDKAPQVYARSARHSPTGITQHKRLDNYM